MKHAPALDGPGVCVGGRHAIVAGHVVSSLSRPKLTSMPVVCGRHQQIASTLEQERTESYSQPMYISWFISMLKYIG
jgi:hypothetical protein